MAKVKIELLEDWNGLSAGAKIEVDSMSAAYLRGQNIAVIVGAPKEVVEKSILAGLENKLEGAKASLGLSEKVEASKKKAADEAAKEYKNAAAKVEADKKALETLIAEIAKKKKKSPKVDAKAEIEK